jgi:NADH-quinone oxidoreductase subunit J
MNDLETPLFLISSVVTVIAALGVVTARKYVYAVLLLTVSMVTLSVVFLLLEAHFVAMIQILIYAGAILVLFLIVIMLLGIEGAEEESKHKTSGWLQVLPFVLAIGFFVELALVICKTEVAWGFRRGVAGTIEAVADSLFTTYLLPFELVSVILLIGILGVVELAQKKAKKSK